MSTEPTGAKVAAAFVAAQKHFGKALKNAKNPHFKSDYADLKACIGAVMESLNEHGLALMQVTQPAENGVSLCTILVHASGETIDGGWMTVPADKQNAHAYGSALTYARRYSLMTMCGLAPEDDDGNEASTATSAAKKTAQPSQGSGKTPLKTWLERIATATSIDHCRNIWKDAKADGLPPQDLAQIVDASEEWEKNHPVIDVGF